MNKSKKVIKIASAEIPELPPPMRGIAPHYLLQTVVTLYKMDRVTAEEAYAAYLNLDKATALVARVGIPQVRIN